MIPFKRFWLEHAAIRHVRAMERLSLIEAVKIGTRMTQALTEAGQSQIAALHDRQFDEAYPQERTTDAPEG